MLVNFYKMKQLLGKTFSSLKIRNYRIYYFGQIISVSGTFLQALAQDWLVLKLTNSGTMLGLVLAFQFLPVLLLTFYGGVIADRYPKLRLLYITQILSAILALGLGILVLSGAVQIWIVFIFALCLGLINSLYTPVSQSFVFEMVGKDEIKNAVSIWVILISFARIIGPAIAGILIVTLGIGLCFIINAISYIAVIIALMMLNKKELHVVPPPPASKSQIRDGLRYVRSTPILFNALLMMAIIGTITYEWQASLPLFSKFILKGDAGTYASITIAMAIGMIFGGLFNATSKTSSMKRLIISAFLFGLTVIIASFATNLFIALLIFFLVGIFSVAFANLSNAILQINTDHNMRGRVMGLWAIAFFGSTAIGGPIIGWIGDAFGAQWTLIIGGLAAILASIIGYINWKYRIK